MDVSKKGDAIMVKASEVSIGLAHELVITACKAGFEINDFTALVQNEEKLEKILQYLRGNAKVVQFKHFIDCNADPYIPGGLRWKIENHNRSGQLEWDVKKLTLHVVEDQDINGYELFKELRWKGLNANVLDYLLKNQELIPDEWKGMVVNFWGTTYRDSGDNLWVRCLFWDGNAWDWTYSGFRYDFKNSAALLKAS